MKLPATDWAKTRKNGLWQYLLLDGILKLGCPFAVVMQIVGYFVLRDESQTFAAYFSSPRTWITFFGHATLFGLVMGILNWYRYERAFKSRADTSGNQ
jgi:hypothetical protein